MAMGQSKHFFQKLLGQILIFQFKNERIVRIKIIPDIVFKHNIKFYFERGTKILSNFSRREVGGNIISIIADFHKNPAN